MLDKGYFNWETYYYLYFKVKTDFNTAGHQGTRKLVALTSYLRASPLNYLIVFFVKFLI